MYTWRYIHFFTDIISVDASGFDPDGTRDCSVTEPRQPSAIPQGNTLFNITKY